MKLFITIIFFIIGVKINAMNLLDYKVDEKKITLEDWKFFSDQVMGGVSEGKTSLKKDQNKLFLRLEGSVSTKNNGGFIQVRKEYQIKDNNYKGIRLKARGIESEYYIHIRTKKPGVLTGTWESGAKRPKIENYYELKMGGII